MATTWATSPGPDELSPWWCSGARIVPSSRELRSPGGLHLPKTDRILSSGVALTCRQGVAVTTGSARMRWPRSASVLLRRPPGAVRS